MSALTIRQAAADLGVNGSTVWRAIASGTLRPVYRVGRVFRIPETTWAEYKRRIVFVAEPVTPAFDGGLSLPLIDRVRTQ